MMGNYWGMPWYGMVFGPMMMIAVLAGIIAAVVLLVRWLGGASMAPPPYSPPEKAPLDILKERLARGEIDTQEFEEKRRTLST
jgi:putative membrane protein